MDTNKRVMSFEQGEKQEGVVAFCRLVVLAKKGRRSKVGKE